MPSELQLWCCRRVRLYDVLRVTAVVCTSQGPERLSTCQKQYVSAVVLIPHCKKFLQDYRPIKHTGSIILFFVTALAMAHPPFASHLWQCAQSASTPPGHFSSSWAHNLYDLAPGFFAASSLQSGQGMSWPWTTRPT